MLDRILGRLLSIALTALGTVVPKSSRSVVVHSFPDFEDGALALLDGLVARGYRPTVLLERVADTTSGCPASVRCVGKNTLRGRYAYLRARTVFTTHGPYRAHTPPRTQRYVHIWHGEPICKPSGLGDGSEPIPSNWSTVLSTIGRAFRAAETALPLDHVLVAGAPRNDRLLTTDHASARDRLIGTDSERCVVAWLPTYRERATSLRNGRIDGAAHDNIVPLSTPDLDYLDEWLGRSNVTLLVKPHPSALRQEAELHNIQVISDDWLAAHNLTNYEMLAGIDALVTDASSVWVDFLLLQRPIIYAFPDLNEYQESRGLNLEPYQAWIPGPLVSDAESLIKYLSKVADDEDEFAPERAIALERFHKYVDAGSTTRLLDALAM